MAIQNGINVSKILAYLEEFASALREQGFFIELNLLGSFEIGKTFSQYGKMSALRIKSLSPKTRTLELFSMILCRLGGKKNDQGGIFIPKTFQVSLTCAGGKVFDHRPTKESLRVVTSNPWVLFRTYKALQSVNDGPSDLDEHLHLVSEALNETDADVITLQEVEDLLTLQVLCSLLKGQYAP